MLDRIKLFRLAYFTRRDREFEEWLAICTPFGAKKHLEEMRDIFATMNKYLPQEKHINISLKVPFK